jgi:ABC-type antimicrobial peptide transport system permease subunit
MHFEPQVGSLKNVEDFRSELLKNPVIESVGQSFDHPMNIFNNDYVRWGSMAIDDKVTVQTTECDYNYLHTLGFKLLQGRFFSPELASDTTGFIINEACAQMMGFPDPIGQRITVYKIEGQIIGVVNDFHNQDLYSKIDPVIFLLNKEPKKPMMIYVRYGQGQLTSAMDHLQKTYKKFESVFPLEVSFLDKDLEVIYKTEILTGRLSVCFTVIAVFISCLGLFGLTLFTTERRKKEIGVRKVLGASVNNLIVLLCRDFMKPILFSLAIGLPIGYYLMTNFLDQFQFHVELSIWAFVLTGISLIAMTMITVSYQSTKAALTNPADTLRTE